MQWPLTARPQAGARAICSGVLVLLLAACSTSGLAPLVLEGPELHASLTTHDLDDGPIRHVPRAVVGGNPYLSADAEFVEAIAHSGSQGRLDGEGVRSALYALYDGEADLGFYGLEAASEADADRLAAALRETWAHNVSIGRARVHRRDLVLVIVWHDGVSPECWDTVNAVVARRLVVQ